MLKSPMGWILLWTNYRYGFADELGVIDILINLKTYH